MQPNIIRPAIYNGQKLHDYGIDRNTGNLYSFKRGFPYKMAWSHRNPKNLKTSYPCTRLVDNEVFSTQYKGGLTVNVHILVQETLNPLPAPRGVSKKDWIYTPQSVKKACRGLWIVNHIDHNKMNYHPSNLEWVFGHKENAEKAQQYYKEAA